MDNKEIAKRFLSLFCDKNHIQIAKELGAQRTAISEWISGRRQVPWKYLERVVSEKKVSWDWLLNEQVKSTPAAIAAGEQLESGERLKRFFAALVKIASFGEYVVDPQYQIWAEDVMDSLDAISQSAPAVSDEDRTSRDVG